MQNDPELNPQHQIKNLWHYPTSTLNKVNFSRKKCVTLPSHQRCAQSLFLVEESAYFSIGWTVVLFLEHSSGTNFHQLYQSCPKKLVLPLSKFLTNCLDNSTLFSKFLLVKSLGTHRAQTWLIFKSGNKMSCTEVFKTLKHFSATSRTVSRQSPSIMSWTSFSGLCNFEMMFLHGFLILIPIHLPEVF